MKTPLAPILCKSLWVVSVALAPLLATLNAQETKPAPATQTAQTLVAEPAEAEGQVVKPAKLDCAWLPFPDNARFKVFGLHWFEENQPKLWRMPAGQINSLPRGVARQARQPA